MANEYLKRTPTSSGNRKQWTWAGWVKRNILGGRQGIFTGLNDVGDTYSGAEFATDNGILWYEDGNTVSTTTCLTTRKFTDVGSWMHLVFVFNSTKSNATDRIKIYVNGIIVDSYGSDSRSGIAQNMLSRMSDPTYTMVTGGWGIAAPQISFNGEMSDVFFVDGQALTPDVFGFYKDGDGYVSAGSAQATDFRPGQWMPHAPRVIKKSIERSGGFGVNGYYLPMNDSFNPGADFHCAPNSIITLKGEDLPQPQNGAPTTSDAYVSQLRPEKEGTLGFDGVAKFDGNGSRLSVPSSSDFNLDNTWTIEYFFYNKGTGVSRLHFFHNDRNNIQTATNGTQLLFYNGSSTTTFGGISLYKWHHLAVVNSSGTVTFYIDGISAGTTSAGAVSAATALTIGGYSDGQNPLDGFISNFRVVNGTAVYTSNFTAPTEPLTNVTNTKLLCCNSVSSPTAATVTPDTITNNGGVVSGKNEIDTCLVLAVPGISTATGANLVSNGTFDNGTTDWNSLSSATLSVVDGKLRVTNSTTSYGKAEQEITTEAGKRYTFSLDSYTGNTSDEAQIRVGSTSNGSDLLAATDVPTGHHNVSFTATGTSSYINVNNGDNNLNEYSEFDNIVVKQEDAPRDYSADIKGSGTNKTLTAAGDAGVGYELGGYYGSAMTFDGTSSIFTIPNSSDFYFDGEFTVECWVNWDGTAAHYQSFVGSNKQSGFNGNTAFFRVWGTSSPDTSLRSKIGIGNPTYDGTNATISGNNLPVGQLTHVAATRDSSNTMRVFMNGVCVGVKNNDTSVYDFGLEGTAIGQAPWDGAQGYFSGDIQDVRLYKGLAKYKGGFDVPKPYTPVGIEAFRTTADTCKNNFATLNPDILNNPGLSDGNLKIVGGSGWRGWVSTFSFTSGKYYMEMHFPDTSTGGSYYEGMGLKHDGFLSNSSGEYFGDAVGKAAALINPGSIALFADGNQGNIATGTYTGSHTMGMAIDANSGKVWWSMDGSWIGANPSTGNSASYTFTAGQTVIPGVTSFNSSITGDLLTLNFGQNPSFSGQTTAGTNTDSNGKGLFKYAPPTGFLALCEDNLPTPAIADPGKHFKSVLYTGSGSSKAITGVGFQPDFVWLKSRTNPSTGIYNTLVDSVRGAPLALFSNSTDTEDSPGGVSSPASVYGGISSFDNNGFSIMSGSSDDFLNENTYSYVAWCWKAGGAAVSNTDGSITSQVSVNQDAGFSIVSYTGNGTDNATVGHGLGKVPDVVFIKNRIKNVNWGVWHSSLASGEILRLSLPIGTEAPNTAYFQDELNTSSVFGLGTNDETNEGDGDTYIAYCWTEIEGYSKFGSYVGNNSADGPFVYCGFKPAWVMVKNTITGGTLWLIADNARFSTNPINGYLSAENSADEYGPLNGDGAYTWIDFLSNGFKLRQTGDSLNRNNETIIFMAFAESPFQTANAK